LPYKPGVENPRAIAHVSRVQWRRVFIFLASGALAGCNHRPISTPPTPPQTAAATNTSITAFQQSEPLGKLLTMKLWLGKQELIAEIAASPRELATGMMHRRDMAENEAMLFILPVPQRASFYMKNTHVPLSCAYIDREGTILEIHDLQPLNEEPVFSRSDAIQFVLEVKQGWFERNAVGVGAVVRSEHGSLAETFFRRRQR
jgi:uncharacterized membrane protein (UPF0127 family)